MLISDDNVVSEIDFADQNETDLQTLLQIPYKNRQELSFHLHKVEGRQETLIKSGVLNFDGFYDNVVYKHDVQLHNMYLILASAGQEEENYYQSSVQVQILIESQLKDKIFSSTINKNKLQGSCEYMQQIYEVDLKCRLRSWTRGSWTRRSTTRSWCTRPAAS